MTDKERKKLRQERKALLTPEQRKVADWWDERFDRQFARLYEVGNALNTGDQDKVRKLVEEIPEDQFYHCPHERSLWKPCGECEDIEHILNPEGAAEDEEEIS
jgi:hypothetical protein